MKRVVAGLSALAILFFGATILQAGEPEVWAESGNGLETKSHSSACSPAGVWYGGAELDEAGLFFKWILNVTPQRGGGYQITGYAGWGADVPIATPMNGVSERIGKNEYEFFAIGYQNPDAGFPPITPPTIIAVHGIMTVIDCNTTRSVYDFQGIYDWGMEPFVDQPILDLGPWTEDYRRMAMPDWPPNW